MNIKELAKFVNLSVTTTSRALNNHDSVAQATRLRVQEVAQKHGYAPNLSARSLKSGKTGNIGIVFPLYNDAGYSHSAFLSEFIIALSQALDKKDYSLVINVATHGLKNTASWKKMIINKQVDAIIVPRLETNDVRIPWLQERNFPFVVFGHPSQKVTYPWLDLDHETAFYQAVMHLYNQNHTKIACIAGPQYLELTQQRISGFKKAMNELQLTIKPEWITHSALDENGGSRAFSTLYAQPTAPTAIICSNDHQAFGVMKRAQEYGLTIGKDLAVIGYDDTLFSAYWKPALTTFHQPIGAIAERLAQMVSTRLNGSSQEKLQELWKAQMIIRQSCGTPK